MADSRNMLDFSHAKRTARTMETGRTDSLRCACGEDSNRGE